MIMYYVATLAHYVLMDAPNETVARELGRRALIELTGDAAPNIRTVRPATYDEIDFSRWHQDALARETETNRR